MKLKNVTESFVKEFAEATIFGRGKEYCQNEMVEEIKYAERILKELNEYGMDDASLEDIAINALDLLPEMFFKSGISQEEKAGIIRSLEKYSGWSNCAITDCVDGALDKIKDE